MIESRKQKQRKIRRTNERRKGRKTTAGTRGEESRIMHNHISMMSESGNRCNYYNKHLDIYISFLFIGHTL